MDVAKIGILVEANSSGVGSGLAPGLGAVQRFANDVETSLKRVGSAWQGLSGGEKVLAGFGVAAGVAAVAIASTIKPAIEFESAFAGVRKTVDGTAPQLEAIRSGILNMSKEMPTAAKDLAAIAESAGQLGVKAPDILNFTRVVAQLGETTDLSFDQAASELARFLNITGQGASQIEPVSNALVALGNAGASTESEIVNFSQRLASAVTVAGGTADQILALASAFSSFGVNAEAGGSALSTIITSISDSAKGGNQHLITYAKTAGLLPEQFKAIALSNPVEALLRFGEGLGEIVRQGGSVTPIMEQVELGGLRTSEVMRLLALNSDQVREALALSALEFANGSARQEEYDKRSETTASRLEKLRNTITAVQIEVGSTFLEGIAIGSDLAAQGISALVEALTPLAGQVEEVFANGGALVEAFWEAIGGAAAKTAVAALLGAIVAVTGLLEALNATGPAGLALAAVLATLALYPPAMAAARAATFSFALDLASVGPAGAAAAAGSAAFQAAISAGPLIAFTAALAATGKAFHDAGTAAKAAGSEIETAFKDALKAGQFDAASGEVEKLTNRMETLRAQLEGKNIFKNLGEDSKGATGFMDRLGTAITGTAEILTPFTDNTVVNAQKELEELQRVAGENGFGLFNQSIESTASRLGLSTDATLALASEMGLLDDLVTGNIDAFYNAQNAMVNFVTVAEDVGVKLNLTKEQAISNATTLEELATATGVSSTALAYLAQRTDEIDFKKMFDGDPNERMDELAKLANKLRFEIEPMATAVGLTTEEFLGQVAAVEALAQAQDELSKAIAGTKSALDSVNAQQRASTESAAAFQDALKGIGKDFSTVEEAASAGRQAILDFAGTGAPIEEVTAKQADLASQLYETATAAGHEKEAVIGVIAELLRVPPSVVSEIIAKGEQAKLEAGIVDGMLHDITDAEWEIMIAANPELAIVRAQMARDEVLAITNAEYDMKISGNPELALHAKSEAKAAYDELVAQEWEMKLSSNPELAKLGALEATEAGNLFAGGVYEANYTAANTEAREAADEATTAGRSFADGRYDGQFTGTNSDALSKSSEAADEANRYAGGRYDASLTATNSDSLGKSSQAEGAATKYARKYDAHLTATDSASSVISGAVSKLAGFVSKSITLTTYTSTSVRPTGALDGAIIDSSGARSFAGGGIYGGGASNLISSIASGAGFYQSLPGVARVFTEPATGGEWYIPAMGNLARSRAIWEDAGRKLGFMDHGGGSGVVIHAPVQISLTTTQGADLQAIGGEVARRVDLELRKLGRQLDNVRTF